MYSSSVSPQGRTGGFGRPGRSGGRVCSGGPTGISPEVCWKGSECPGLLGRGAREFRFSEEGKREPWQVLVFSNCAKVT